MNFKLKIEKISNQRHPKRPAGEPGLMSLRLEFQAEHNDIR